MGWFSRKPKPEKQVEAAIKVATNLYLHTIPEAEDAPLLLRFKLPDSRYRYLIFCLSTVITAVLAYDEKKKVQPETLINGCMNFANWAGAETGQDFFSGSSDTQEVSKLANSHFTKFMKKWSKWPSLEKEGKTVEAIGLICSMIHESESNVPVEDTDVQRLGELGLQIACRMPTMNSAFLQLAKL